jgi:hypothetical protein
MFLGMGLNLDQPINRLKSPRDHVFLDSASFPDINIARGKRRLRVNGNFGEPIVPILPSIRHVNPFGLAEL